MNKSCNLSFKIPKGFEGGEVLESVKELVISGFSEEWSAQFEFCRSDQYIDILPGIHKLDGIDLMLSWLGLQPSEAIAVGDYLNDLAVFEGFDQVMCPANAHEKIIALTKQKGEGSYVSNDSYGASMIDFFQRML